MYPILNKNLYLICVELLALLIHFICGGLNSQSIGNVVVLWALLSGKNNFLTTICCPHRRQKKTTTLHIDLGEKKEFLKYIWAFLVCLSRNLLSNSSAEDMH